MRPGLVPNGIARKLPLTTGGYSEDRESEAKYGDIFSAVEERGDRGKGAGYQEEAQKEATWMRACKRIERARLNL